LVEVNKVLQIILPQDMYETYLKVISNVAFTRREIDMIACILSGRSVKRIASILSISPRTVQNHVHNIMLKLGCRSQEHIRDLIEQSEQYEDLKTYYHSLKIQGIFEGILRRIRDQISQEKESLFFYTGDLAHPLFQKMVKDLAISGIRVSVQNNEQKAAEVAIAIEDKDVIITQKPYAYYLAIFEILKNTFPQLDLSPYQTEFKGHMEVREKGVNNSEAPKKDSFWTFKRFSVRWALLASFLGALLSASFFWILGSSQPIPQIHKGGLSQNKGSTSSQSLSLLSSWNLPFLPDSHVPRVKSAEAVWDQLLNANNQTTTKVVGLTGPGGVGKTFLAMYCIHNPKQPYAFRAWFNAETLDVLKANYFELGEKLQLFLPRMSEEQKIREVKIWLESRENILLVYDNAANVDDLYEFFPNNAHIIITSRNYKMPNATEVGVMNLKESLYLLENLIPLVIKQDAMFAEDSVKLVNELNYFPLAISQAAAYITENVVSISGYLELYAKERKNLLSNKALLAGKQQTPIYVTWDMNLEAMRKVKEGEQALNLLGFISFCRPGNIPKRLLIQCLYGKTDEKAVLEFNALVGVLRKYSLIRATTETISIHRLVSDWLKDKFMPEERIKYLKKIMEGIQGIYPKKIRNIEDDFLKPIVAQNYNLISSLMPKIKRILPLLEPFIGDQEKIPLYALCAEAHYNLDDLGESKIMLEKLLTLKEKYYGANHIEIVKTLINILRVLSALGEEAQAEIILKKVLAINEELYNIHYAEGVLVMQQLSSFYYSLGEGQKCLKSIEKALSIAEKHYAPDHPEIGNLLFRYARAHLLLGNYLKSRELAYKALSINKKAYGEKHDVAFNMQTLGTTYYALGDISQGKAMIERALAIFRSDLRADHIFCAGSQINLGLMHYELGQLEESKKYLQEALKIRIKFHKLNHIWTGFAFADLGLVYVSLGNEKEGRELLEKSLVVIDRNYGSNPIWCSFLLNRVAVAYYLLGEQEKSQQLWLRALEKVGDEYGKDHVFYAIIAANLGNVYRSLGDKEKSKQLLEEAYNTLKRHWGIEHPTTLKAQVNLALWESDLGNQRKKGNNIQYPF